MDHVLPNENPPRARAMRGATMLLRDILSDLGAAAARAEPAAAEPSATLGDLIDRLDERAFGLMLLLLALPCCLPFVYVLPQIVSVPMLALAAQMAIGRRAPWLPNSLRKRTFSVGEFKAVIDRSEKYVGWVERFARPRLRPVTGHGGARLVGLLLLAPCLSIMTPLPMTNTVPGIGVAIAALGLIERDGILVVLGLLAGLGWVALLLFAGVEGIEFLKTWIAARF